jgi:hypothetical protein
MWLHATTVFLSAFLLFQIQPLLGKAILPWFGGTPAVWTTCLLFFQVLLLVGYAYAYWLARQPAPRQRWIHLAVLGGSLFFLQILPDVTWRPTGNENPAWRILGLLAATIGVPYVTLSATGPLLQTWFRGRYPDRSPYRLYALSNVGSLLALLGYPFVVEPWLPLRLQATGWAAMFVAFAAVCAACAWRVPLPVTMAATAETAPPTRRWLWVAFPACGSVLLLATTNQLTQDVSVVPFLWVLPLSLYLLSFILCFDSDRWYRRGVWLTLWPLAAAGVGVALFRGVELALRWQVLLHTAGLFVSCMVCHGELARRRPAPQHLTGFYLLVAAGGALGGICVGLVAPVTLPDLYKYHGVWVVTGGLLAVVLFAEARRWPAIGFAVAATILAGAFIWQVHRTRDSQVDIVRNFYGVLRVKQNHYAGENWPSTRLLHGRITHGLQFNAGEYQHEPVSYYASGTGVGAALRVLPRRPRQIGVVGLGAGIMAAWGRTNDVVRFYEINPGIVRLCDKHFSYRAATPARGELLMGDARLTLEREAADPHLPGLDLLVLDAFSSDSIPLHLLTREAFAVYARRLRPEGVLAVHISNRFLRLEPLVRGLAADAGLSAALLTNDADGETGTDQSAWVLVTGNKDFLASPIVKLRQQPWPDKVSPLVFTDAYSNLYQLLR